MKRTVNELLKLFLGNWSALSDDEIDQILDTTAEIEALDRNAAATRSFFELEEFKTKRTELKT